MEYKNDNIRISQAYKSDSRKKRKKKNNRMTKS